MTTFGYFLSSEEFTPADLLRQARLAEEAGFEALWISDHFHPWNDEQGQSPFVWSVIGALSRVTRLPVTTAVTCPTVRVHPAIVAQAAATSAVLHEGRFRLGVGTGEALNEHVLGDRWPSAGMRLAMLEEAVEVMRRLWTGDEVTHRGEHYTVENARLYTVPDEPVPVYVSAFGPKALGVAARIGDGFCNTVPSGEMVSSWREQGGGDKPAQAGTKVCWGTDRDASIDTVHRLWPNEGLPGDLSQVLPTPQHFMQATQLVPRDMIADSVVCGDDVDAGYDEVYVQQIGPDQEAFFEAYRDRVLPALR